MQMAKAITYSSLDDTKKKFFIIKLKKIWKAIGWELLSHYRNPTIFFVMLQSVREDICWNT